MTEAKVLVSILNWNKAKETLACTESLKGEIDGLSVQATVYVTDNASQEDDFAVLEQGLKGTGMLFRRLPRNLGFTGGHNVTIRIAIDEAYDFIWLLNNDAKVKPGALRKLVEEMDAHPMCGAASPLIREATDESVIEGCVNTHDWQSRGSNWIKSIEQGRRIQSEHPESVWLAGTAIFFRVQALKQVGLLDDQLFAYYDDNDIGARLIASAWYSRSVFDASVLHAVKRIVGPRPNYYYYLMQRNELLFWQKNTPPQFRRLLWFKLLDTALFNVNRLYRKGLKSQGDAALLGVWDFICRRFGAPVTDRNAPLILRIVCSISAAINDKKLVAYSAPASTT